MESNPTTELAEEGIRVVIDVQREASGKASDPPSDEAFLAIASVTDLPAPDIRTFDHERTLAMATGRSQGEAGAAAASVIAAWLSDAKLTTDRLWEHYGDLHSKSPQDDARDAEAKQEWLEGEIVRLLFTQDEYGQPKPALIEWLQQPAELFEAALTSLTQFGVAYEEAGEIWLTSGAIRSRVLMG